MRVKLVVVAAVLVGSLPQGPAAVLAQTQTARRPDVIYVPTPQAVAEGMLQVANVTKNDVVYDLGCGDGRIPITAARKYGAKAVCIDIDPDRIKEIKQNVEAAKMGHLVTVIEADLFTQDLSPASVVTLYLLPSLNLKLMPKLMKELKPGTRVVSHAFDMGDWRPDKELDVDSRKIYFWTIPKNKPASDGPVTFVRGGAR